MGPEPTNLLTARPVGAVRSGVGLKGLGRSSRFLAGADLGLVSPCEVLYRAVVLTFLLTTSDEDGAVFGGRVPISKSACFRCANGPHRFGAACRGATLFGSVENHLSLGATPAGFRDGAVQTHARPWALPTPSCPWRRLTEGPRAGRTA